MPMKVLGISGSPIKGEGDLEYLLQGVLKGAGKKGVNVNTEIARLADTELSKGCIHCGWCLRYQTEEKYCSQNDGMEEIYRKIIEADAIVVATPVCYGNISWLLSCFLDRLKALAEGRFYGVNGPMDGVLVDKTMAGCVLAKLGQDGSERALQTILMTAGLYGMIPVTLPIGLWTKFGYKIV